MSPLYLFELLYLVTFQLKLWYFVGALADDMIRLTHNNKALGKNILSPLTVRIFTVFGHIWFIRGLSVTQIWVATLLFTHLSVQVHKKGQIYLILDSALSLL